MTTDQMKEIFLSSKYFEQYGKKYFQQNPIVGFEKIENSQLLNIKKLKEDIRIQEIKNAVFLKELSDFSDFCSKRDIRYIGLKGIFFALEFYMNYNDRIFGDVDLLISPQDGKHIFDYFYSKGYKLKKYKSLPFYNNKFLSKHIQSGYFKQLHHLEMVKMHEYDDKKSIELMIEIHFNLNTNLKINFDCKEMFKNSKSIKNYNGITFNRFNNDDYFIYLCVNICAHIAFIYPILNKLTIDFQKLNDLILLASNSFLDWDNIIKKCQKYNVLEYVGFISKILNALTDSLIPKKFLDDINFLVSELNIKWRKVYYLNINKTNVVDIILGIYPTLPCIKYTQEKIQNNHYSRLKKQRIWQKVLEKN